MYLSQGRKVEGHDLATVSADNWMPYCLGKRGRLLEFSQQARGSAADDHRLLLTVRDPSIAWALILDLPLFRPSDPPA